MEFPTRTAVLLCLAAGLGAAQVQIPQQPPAAAAATEQPGATPPAQVKPEENKPAQAEQSVTEMTSRDEPAMFKTRVNLVMAPVVVRDSKGKTVTGLTKADFLL